MSFKLIKKSSTHDARAGVVSTPHGEIRTPVFMPVGTQATVKSLTPDQVASTEADILLANTYHLTLRPGVDLIESFGGLHDFMGWNKPILTDSGGYQVFSLGGMRKIVEEGVEFKSHLDGSKHFFSPERVVDLQLGFNSDILMPLDICSPYPCEKHQVQSDLERTTRWMKRCKAHWEPRHTGQQLFAIVQGGMFEDLRVQSAEQLVELELPGYAIGGLSVGESLDSMEEMLDVVLPLLPEDKPRYLMGVGLPENLEMAIRKGVDMFDCVAATRLARHGQFFSPEGRLSIKNKRFSEDKLPLEEGCDCYACQRFSRAYIRHLFMAKETLAHTLMSLHNIRTLVRLVLKIRAEVLAED